MTRPLAAVALVASFVTPAVTSAQVGSPPPSGPIAPGGGVVFGGVIASGPTTLIPLQPPTPPRFSVGGGSMSAPPQVWLPTGAWGGVSYPWPVYPITEQRLPVSRPAATVRPTAVTPQLDLSGEANATLVVQFPAAAEVWVGGKKSDGAPAAEWTLTSPTLLVGDPHTFEVRGRWKEGGKTFETSRSVTVTAGDRNRLIVVSGAELKE